MYIPDNNDVFTAHEREQDRIFRIDRRIQADEAAADYELPWVTIPDDYGTHDRDLYYEEDSHERRD